MNPLELVRAERKRIAAEEEAKKAAADLVSMRKIQLFEPVFQLVQPLLDLPSRSYRWHSKDIIQYRLHFDACTPTQLRYWDGAGNTGLVIYVDDALNIVQRIAWGKNTVITVEKAKEMVINHAAQYLVEEEAK